MEVISLEQNFNRPIVLCLGFFDCMHVGHIALLEHAKKLAQNASVALFTFSNSHFETLKRPVKLIYTFRERLDLYESLGVDVTLHANFDEKFMSMSGVEFLKKISVFNLKAVVCGADFTCGSDVLSATDVATELSGKCPVHVVDLVKQNGKKVCSSFVRELISSNKIAKANEYLSEPFFFKGKVEHGRAVGHTLGFPTVNLAVSEEKLAPQGVFAGVATVDNKKYRAVVNVGSIPTFGVENSAVEAHLLGFDGNLYGKTVKISLTNFLRPIQKFPDASALKKQLSKDVEVVKND